MGTAAEREALDGTRLVELYCSLRQGQSVKNWCEEHAELLGVVDLRRFFTFGVIKGFLYRVHKYAVATGSTASLNAMGGKRVKEKLYGELEKFLDGNHCFDEICTELMISERELQGRLKGIGDVQII